VGGKVLIWSVEHKGYLSHAGSEYSKNLCDAALYSYASARQICVKTSSTMQRRIIELEDAFISLQLEVKLKINQ
jgi:hypothetical protein